MAGVLDTTFGSNGTFVGGIPSSNNRTTKINTAIIDNSNNIIVAGGVAATPTGYEILIYGMMRFLPNGQIDTTFGDSGYKTGRFIENQDAEIYSLAIDSSNNIIAGGYTFTDYYCLAKFLPNGQLDTTFGTNNGFSYENFLYNGNWLYSEIFSIQIDSSNNIIALCNGSKTSLNIYRYTLARFLSNGQLDSTFGSDGYFTAQVENFKTKTYQHTLDNSNNIYVAGNCGITTNIEYYFVSKYFPNGQLDTTFGTNGTVYGNFLNITPIQIMGINLDITNKILISGINGTTSIIARFLQDGQLDSTFGNGGVVSVSSSNTARQNTLKVDGLNRIICYTLGGLNTNYIYNLSRFLNNGQIDSTFGTNGVVSIPYISADVYDSGLPVVVDKLNNIFVSGYNNEAENFIENFFLSKYLTSDTPPVSNVCFPAGTLISTNQGNIPIEKINPSKHTVRNKKIVGITRTVVCDKYTVCFEKGALGNNIPSQKTCISKNHKIFYKGQMVKAYEFIGTFPNVYKQPYHGETLYNVLLEEHDKMVVNNLICETLHPENPLAKLYILLQKFAPDQQQKIINKYNHMHMKK